MTLGGNADFQAQIAPTSTVLATIAVNTLTNQTVSILANLQPTHQGVVFIWIASGGWIGSPITVSMASTGPASTIMPGTTMADQGVPLVWELPAAWIINNATDINVTVVNPLGAGTMTGTLVVIAQASPMFVGSPQRYGANDEIQTTGNVTGTAGGDSVVLAAAPIGDYYRVRAMWSNHGAAPAAATRLFWKVNGVPFLSHFVTAVAVEQLNWLTDFRTSQAIAYNNTSSVNMSVGLLYEHRSDLLLTP